MTKSSNGPAACIIGFVVVFAVALCLAPSIVWLVMGNVNLGDNCSRDASTPDLATWLIIKGSIGIVTFFLIIFTIVSAACASRDFDDHVTTGTVFCGCTAIISMALICLICLFDFAWCIVGAIQLSDDQYCQDENPALYNTALAAVILGFISIFLTIVRQCSSQQKSGQ